ELLFYHVVVSYSVLIRFFVFFFFQAEDGIRDRNVTGVQTCALPISSFIAARSRSPVVILGSPSRSARIFPCVPLPDPGAPRMRMNTYRTGTSGGSEPARCPPRRPSHHPS